MGKIKRSRKTVDLANTANSIISKPLLQNGDLFKNIPINLNSLSKNLETQSVKSAKSDSAVSITVPKKDKLKMRREIFLQKLNMSRMNNKEKLKKRKKKNDVAVFNTNPLNDALPSLDSLLKSRAKVNVPYERVAKKKKAIEKANKVKRQQLLNIDIYKQILKNKQFEKDAFGAISGHIANIVSQPNK